MRTRPVLVSVLVIASHSLQREDISYSEAPPQDDVKEETLDEVRERLHYEDYYLVPVHILRWAFSALSKQFGCSPYVHVYRLRHQ